MNAPPALIDDSLAALMTGGQSISAASCSAGGMPSAARALGCRLGPGAGEATILVARAQAAALLADIAAGGQLAVTFSEVSTHRAVQLKARSAAVEDAAPGDAGVAARYCAAFIAQLVPMGYSADMIETFLQRPSPELAALRFTPCAAFVQTPGPQAGRTLRAAP
jgi:hypothetical protein